jgi:hypothetical protein
MSFANLLVNIQKKKVTGLDNSLYILNFQKAK